MSKILFVCSGNVARSQWAQGYYNHFTNCLDASSAGINANPSKYPQLPDVITSLMAEEGIDIRDNDVKSIDELMVENADVIYVMCPKHACPDYLKNSDKTIYWDVKDPYNVMLGEMRAIRNQIKEKVKEIVNNSDQQQWDS